VPVPCFFAIHHKADRREVSEHEGPAGGFGNAGAYFTEKSMVFYLALRDQKYGGKKSSSVAPPFPPLPNRRPHKPSIVIGIPLLSSCPRKHRLFNIKCVDPPVAEIPNQQIAAKRAKIAWRKCQAPR
jgi:hypothetical protein